MTRGLHDIEQRLKDLRGAFDNTFASPPAEPQRDWIEFLLVSLGDQQFALPMRDLSGLEVNRKIVPMPMEVPWLLGLSAVGGQLVSVFDLAAIMGLAGRKESARWMVLYRDAELIGLAFDELHGSRRVATQDVHRLELVTQKVQLTGRAIQIDGRAIHMVDMAAVASSIRNAIHPR